MLLKLAGRLLLEADKRLLWKLLWRVGVKGVRSVEKHKRRLKRGEYFPPFLYISIINSCNLRCQGCWVDVAAPQQTIDLKAMNRLIGEAKAMGNSFFGIVGGEPFMHPELFEILEANRDCYFQIFTNGQFITDEKARRLRKLGNATPLISVEGNEVVSDVRRGRPDVWNRTMAGIYNAVNNRLLTGVCTSVCQTNIDDLVSERWIDRLIEMGVLYTWFHVYRPMGPEANPQLALSPDQQRRLREFVVEMRAKKPIIIIDAYYDGEGKALCPAATGISHHINPWGGIEPCPIIQFVTDDIHDRSKSLYEKFNSPYMRDVRRLMQQTTRGCIVLERPDLLKQLVQQHGARDGTARGTALAELEAMQPRPSQYNPQAEIPEKSWVYRFAKRRWFSDFGVYNGQEHGAPDAASAGVTIEPEATGSSAPRT